MIAQKLALQHQGDNLLNFDDYGVGKDYDVHHLLMIFQTGALLEVFHAMFGIVRSNVMTTFMQVMSRIYIVWGVNYLSPDAQKHWGSTMAVAAWSAVEVIRYSYLAANTMGTPPYWMMWIRYSAFIVLYPVGITGENVCIFAARDDLRNFSTNFW